MSEKAALIEDGNKASRIKFLTGITGAFGFSVASVTGFACIQLMDQIPPDFELTVFRFGVGLIFSSFYLLVKQKRPRIDKSNIKWLVAVSFFILGLHSFCEINNICWNP